MELRKEELVTLFKLLTKYDCSDNSLKYVVLQPYGINPKDVLSYLKDVGKFNKKNDNILKDKLHECTFMDIAIYYTPDDIWDQTIPTSYELAAEYLLSNYVTKDFLKEFLEMIVVTYFNLCQEEDPSFYTKLPMEDEQIAKIMSKVQ